MKCWKRLAAALVVAGMMLAMFTACGAANGTGEVTWDKSRTKQYYESNGVTDEKIALKATVSNAGRQGVYEFTRDGARAYMSHDFGESDNIRWFTDTSGYVYGGTIRSGYWNRFEPESSYGSTANIIQAGGEFIIPTAKNTASITAGKETLNGKTYFVETLKMDVNGSYYEYSYYFDSNGLSFVQAGGKGVFQGTFVITKLSGTPNSELLKQPKYNA